MIGLIKDVESPACRRTKNVPCQQFPIGSHRTPIRLRFSRSRNVSGVLWMRTSRVAKEVAGEFVGRSWSEGAYGALLAVIGTK